MSITSAFYSGVSGLQCHGESMAVIGNNIANVSTYGFKSSRMDFKDLLGQTYSTSVNSGQIGRGATIGAIMSDFSQGSFETTSEATDLAIGGNGFFVVKAPGSDMDYYTRAGNFRFDKDGYLIDPNGLRLQGKLVDANKSTSSDSAANIVTGTETDIQLNNFTSPAKATTTVSLISNLSFDTTRKSTDTTDPFFAMLKSWSYDPTDTTAVPLGDGKYSYQSTVKVYDQIGKSHTLTVYYDPVSNAGGKQYWEYLVTCSPSEDGRTISGVNMNTTSAAGLLMTGTLTFSADGTLEHQSAFTLDETKITDPTNLKDLSNWTPAEFSTNGYPEFTANFRGVSNASSTSSVNAINISLDLGLQDNAGTPSWINPAGGTAVANAAAVGTSVDNIPRYNKENLSAKSTTNNSTASTSVYQSQNGYAPGSLQSVSVDGEGVLTGTFSNGQVQKLYVITLATFKNQNALRREGSNLYTETIQSGAASTNIAGTSGSGSISSNSLEQSNTDLATEFVRMITIQRGYQANSKVITTTDTMLSELIALKR